MGYPTFEEAQIYKSRTIQHEVRAAVELDYPVFSGSFSDTFPSDILDTDKWFSFVPSWGTVTVVGSTLTLAVTGNAISPPYIQSRHNLAFPLRRDTDWTFETRLRFPTVEGFGVFLRVCGRSFRDAEAILAIKNNTASGLEVHMPDGFFSDGVHWAPGADTSWNRYLLEYDASAGTYTLSIDADDDGVFEVGPFVTTVDGRYADAIVIGNSTAIQGTLGAWTVIEVDYVDVTGTAEAVEDPDWAAPFAYDGTRMSYLPTLKSGRVSIDKQNMVDGAEIVLDNFGLADDASPDPQMYTWMRFLNRRAIIEARAGDGNGAWAPWEVLFDGRCAEKQVTLDEGGNCSLSVPMRDRWRSQADDIEVLAAYSDAGVAIDGVSMNMDVAGIIEDLYQVKCGLGAAAMNVTPTPNNTPRNYNVFRQSAQSAVASLAEQAALAVYQDRSNAQVQVQEWAWGSDSPGYYMSTAEEVRFLRWSESTFDVTSAEQISFENTKLGGVLFAATWPPHSEPWYGRRQHSDSVVCQTSSDHDARPISALRWWARNRNLGSIEITASAQFWVEHDLEIGIKDDRFLGFGRGETFILDGWEHSWDEGGACMTRIRLINPHPDRFLRQNLMP